MKAKGRDRRERRNIILKKKIPARRKRVANRSLRLSTSAIEGDKGVLVWCECGCTVWVRQRVCVVLAYWTD